MTSAFRCAYRGSRRSVSVEVTRMRSAEAKLALSVGDQRHQAIDRYRAASFRRANQSNPRHSATGAYSPPASGPNTNGMPRNPIRLGNRAVTNVTWCAMAKGFDRTSRRAMKNAPICQRKKYKWAPRLPRFHLRAQGGRSQYEKSSRPITDAGSAASIRAWLLRRVTTCTLHPASARLTAQPQPTEASEPNSGSHAYAESRIRALRHNWHGAQLVHRQSCRCSINQT